MILQENDSSNDKHTAKESGLLEKELTALEDIIVTVGSTMKVETVLERIVEVTAKTVGADDLFIYLLDEENKDLILSAATKNQAYVYIGEFRIKVGEGVTGNVALTYEPYLIQKSLKQNPVFVLTPELGDCNYESFLCVPIISKNNKLIGIMSIYSAEKYYFHSEHTQMTRRIALLVAGAIENAKLYELTNKRAYVLEKLANFSNNNMSSMSTSEISGTITEIIGDIMNSELSIMIVHDESNNKNVIFNSSFQTIDNTKEKTRLMQRNVTKISKEVSNRELNKDSIYAELENNIYRLFKDYVSVKIVTGNESLGSLHCFSNKKSFLREDQSILNLIANQTSLIIKNKLLEEEIEKTNEKNNFFNDIELGNITDEELRKKIKRFGLNPKESHTFVVIALSDYQQANEDFGRAFGFVLETIKPFTSTFISAENNEEMVILVPTKDTFFIKNLEGKFNELLTSLKEDEIVLTIGISQPTCSTNEYTTALIEAREALKIGALLYGIGSTYTLEDVSYYLYLRQFNNGIRLREPYRLRIQRVAEYDRKNNTHLLTTLKVFLEYGGNIKKTANNLFTHRNTVYQRLNKIEEITTMDLSIEKQWFPLQLVLKIYELKDLTL